MPSQQLGKVDYARMLIKFNTEKDIQLLNLYGSHPLKKRIRFLFNTNSHHMKKLLYLLVLPCFALAMFSFAPLHTDHTTGTGIDRAGVVLKQTKGGKTPYSQFKNAAGGEGLLEGAGRF